MCMFATLIVATSALFPHAGNLPLASHPSTPPRAPSAPIIMQDVVDQEEQTEEELKRQREMRQFQELSRHYLAMGCAISLSDELQPFSVPSGA